jgi:SSS family transporter
MPWLVVGMSMYASLTSAVTYMGLPGAAYTENIALLVVCFVSPAVAPFLILLFYPFYRRLGVTTSYEYVFHRFGPTARTSVSSLFLLARLGWMGTVVYAPALALSVASGLPLWLTILLMGVLATTYTALGGLAADIWTDVAQFVIMVGGAIWVAVSLSRGVPGGVAEIIAVARATGHLKVVDWHFSLYEMSGIVVALTFFFQLMQDYGTDQVTVQRLLSIRGSRGLARAVIFNALTDFVIIGLLLFIGLGLFAYYRAFPDTLGAGVNGDGVFPFYIVQGLPPGVSGLLLAAVFAAAMSSMDSGINSLAAVIINDFVKPARQGRTDESRDLALARILTVVLGGVTTALAFFVSSIGHIIKAYTTFVSLFSAPVLALFLLGMLTGRGTFAGWIVGCAVSLPATLWLQRGVEAHWVYYFPFSFFICFAVGFAVSLAVGGGTAREDLTVWGCGQRAQGRRAAAGAVDGRNQ